MARHRPDATLSCAINRWLVVDGGVKRIGGQDRANFELVRYLSVKGAEVHVVAHEVDPVVREWPGVAVHLVGRPLRSTFLGERLLEATTDSLLATLGPGTLVVSNGGNYPGHVVWVHSVHAAWPVRDDGAPFHHLAFNRFKKWDAVRREASVLRSAKLIVANSRKTMRDLVEKAGVPAHMIEVIYFGSDPIALKHPSPLSQPQIAFVGALGWDRNKGLDVALRSFALLVARAKFRHRLVVAGPGSTSPWRRLAEQLGVTDRVDFLGLVADIPGLLANSDLLISPSRYEAYGLAVQEALAAGVPAIVSADAGVVERLPPELQVLCVHDKESPEAWASVISNVLHEITTIRLHVNAFRSSLLERTWAEMAHDFAKTVEFRLR